MNKALWESMGIQQRVLQASRHGLEGKTGSKAYETLTQEEKEALNGIRWGLPFEIKGQKENTMPLKKFKTPSGGTYTRMVGGKTSKKAGKKASKAKGEGVTHKAYSYKNKAGKTIHIKAHIEHPNR